MQTPPSHTTYLWILFFPCARCEDAEAFEVQDGGKSTGIFTKYLNKHILENRKVTHVLEQVSEGQCLASIVGSGPHEPQCHMRGR